MHQPPTIPEGDEENEGVEQVDEGAHFPAMAQQQPSFHDTLTPAAELQSLEDRKTEQEERPSSQAEIVAATDEIPEEVTDQAEHEESSSMEQPIVDDEVKAGAPSATDEENEIQRQSAQEGALA